MKKKILLLMGVFSLGILNAQVGINTLNPFGIFHVDSKGNTGGTASSPSNDSDDVIVTNEGKVGIGTAAPTEKLDVRGKIRIADGTQSDGYVLKSDASGNAYWGPTTGRSLVVANEADDSSGKLQNVFTNLSSNIANYFCIYGGQTKYTGVSLTLGEGTWQVIYNATFGGRKKTGATEELPPANLIWYLSTSQTILSPSTIVGKRFSSSGLEQSKVYNNNQIYMPTTGLFVLENTTLSPQTFYVHVECLNIPATDSLRYTGEARMWALPVTK
ncbi:hypothetical protein [Dysgonomonas macrotermitis]|uniref:Uncharacterized protein n=1 Tax=Dysgonomonas macrotermitis TaxID=1346286 RepID=A0A1M4ZS33_9BACT|nr:hypothetical protein [Dysgonomonas macrotermitis]SHF20831.1 hypothetical protein SAMN05444362_104172 [Dysgonomonas macrotermitis]